MKIKITGKNPERFNENLTAVLNIACVVAGRGELPAPNDIETGSGRYWMREEKRFQLLPINNDYWAHIRGEGENFIIIEFLSRNDYAGISNALSGLILSRFTDCVHAVQ